ncbi:MAG: hypothetical protein KKE29_19905 [Proteobacteria bacterium]|nr:hypothetical protein [Pseudomonadota bacterium]MBU4574426.1 hypothetical protein [Pseudomonadota bacterium]MBV1715955.1 hypothetical protein [Desulfarculus sp.]
MAKQATEDQLGELHAALARVLKSRIENGDATAADLNCARQFLKDNGIEAIPGENKSLDELTKAVREFNPDEIHKPH